MEPEDKKVESPFKDTDKAPEGTPEGSESKPDAGTSPEQDTPTAFYKSKYEESESKNKELEKELEQARYTLAQKRIEDKDKPEDKDTPVSVDPAEIAKQVREQLAKEQAEAFRESLPSRIEDKEELAQVEYFLDNVIKPTGNPEHDLAIALSLANGKKYQAQNEEMSRAINNKGKQTDLSSNKVDGDGEAQLSEADKAFIKLADSKKSNKA